MLNLVTTTDYLFAATLKQSHSKLKYADCMLQSMDPSRLFVQCPLEILSFVSNVPKVSENRKRRNGMK